MDNIFSSPIGISLKTSVVATVINFFLGVLVARWMVSYKGKGQAIIDGILITPLVLPPTVTGFILLLIFGRSGPIGKLLFLVGKTIVFSWPATVVAATVVSFPMMYQSSKAAFELIDSNIINAARTLGVSDWKIFLKIMVPLAWPGIAAGTILTFTRALGEFGATLMFAGNIPQKTQTIPIAIYFAAEGGRMDQAVLYVVLMIIISLTMIVLLNLWKKRQIYKSWR